MARILLLVLLAASAGCLGAAQEATPPAPAAAAPAKAPAMDWSPGTWWAYTGHVQGVPFDVTIVVGEETPTGYLLGTNLTSGFFGLPWSGNASRDRNPVLAGEEWPLFRFPLADGATWGYEMRGYDATATARAASIPGPDGAQHAGYAIEARSWGQTFARYDYAEDLGWFSRLQLIEPTDGSTVLEATLVAYGGEYDDVLYVERVLRDLTVAYPGLPGEVDVRIPAGALEVHAVLTARAQTGVVSATLVDGAGRALAQATALGRAEATERVASSGGSALSWRLQHAGAGLGEVHIEVTGVFAREP